MPVATPVPVTSPPLPPAHIPVVDPKTGLMTEGWYRYHVAMQDHEKKLLKLLAEIVSLIP